MVGGGTCTPGAHAGPCIRSEGLVVLGEVPVPRSSKTPLDNSPGPGVMTGGKLYCVELPTLGVTGTGAGFTSGCNGGASTGGSLGVGGAGAGFKTGRGEWASTEGPLVVGAGAVFKGDGGGACVREGDAVDVGGTPASSNSRGSIGQRSDADGPLPASDGEPTLVVVVVSVPESLSSST